MKKYRFQIKKHVRDDMYHTEFVEVELTDSEYRNIKSDDSDYSKASALVSAKLGQNVKSLGFPKEVKAKESGKKSSLFRPLWALPFKLIYRIITGF